MAYVSQELKKKLAPEIKSICKKYGVRATLAVDHHSTLVLNVWESKIDFIGDYESDHIQVNTYHIDSRFEGIARDFLTEVLKAMMVGNHDNSDIMTDYFDVGWYVDINIGRWNKPYKLKK